MRQYHHRVVSSLCERKACAWTTAHLVQTVCPRQKHTMAGICLTSQGWCRIEAHARARERKGRPATMRLSLSCFFFSQRAYYCTNLPLLSPYLQAERAYTTSISWPSVAVGLCMHECPHAHELLRHSGCFAPTECYERACYREHYTVSSSIHALPPQLDQPQMYTIIPSVIVDNNSL